MPLYILFHFDAWLIQIPLRHEIRIAIFSFYGARKYYCIMIKSVLNTIVNPNNEPLTFELKVKRDLMNEEN